MKLNYIRFLLFFPLTSLSVFASSVANIELVLSAIEHQSTFSQKNWSFQMERQEKDKVSVIEYLPIIDGVGEVILRSVNGEEPTEKQLKEFKKHNTPRKPSPEDEKDDTFDVVDPTTLRFVSSEKGETIFSFVPVMDFGKEAGPVDEIQGLLVFDEVNGFVKSLTMESLKPFKPDVKFKVKKMKIQIDFAKTDQDAILVTSVETMIKARALLVMGVDQEETITFSNYKKSEG